ncbi:hypothetical protein J512_4064 [Acinetobacter baumannii 1295743]|uniref:Uncharacterized protein n=1 Tax=Acinetobacter baumannii (strain 1295743) TaxID=1310613 RepID=A0A009HLE4_ACIB9|nr:hypothetical protein J512_4412 [Acinetobacter baumannii 1295743]EXB03431.1 hypothetical protein J512_4064 [Acinetobacter baumannii 1295743]
MYINININDLKIIITQKISKKSILKQVGFFMSCFGMFCQ